MSAGLSSLRGRQITGLVRGGWAAICAMAACPKIAVGGNTAASAPVAGKAGPIGKLRRPYLPPRRARISDRRPIVGLEPIGLRARGAQPERRANDPPTTPKRAAAPPFELEFAAARGKSQRQQGDCPARRQQPGRESRRADGHAPDLRPGPARVCCAAPLPCRRNAAKSIRLPPQRRSRRCRSRQLAFPQLSSSRCVSG